MPLSGGNARHQLVALPRFGSVAIARFPGETRNLVKTSLREEPHQAPDLIAVDRGHMAEWAIPGSVLIEVAIAAERAHFSAAVGQGGSHG